MGFYEYTKHWINLIACILNAIGDNDWRVEKKDIMDTWKDGKIYPFYSFFNRDEKDNKTANSDSDNDNDNNNNNIVSIRIWYIVANGKSNAEQ